MNHSAPHRLLLRSSLIRIVLGLGLIAGAGSLTQCRMSRQSVTGVDLNTVESTHGRHRRGCVRECNEAYREAREDEDERHRKALCACKGDRECKADERKLHQSNREKLKEQRRECKRGCYDEGGGHGGR